MTSTNIRMIISAISVSLLTITALGCNSSGTITGGGEKGTTLPTNPSRNATSNAPQRLPVGPYKSIKVGDFNAPWYLIPFDGDGRCEAPVTRSHMIASIQTNHYTDVFIFSHGWNNNWADANRLYDGWLRGFAELRRANNLTIGREFRPLFIGVIWPSTALVLPSEQGPDFRSDEPDIDDYVGQEREEIRTLAQALPEADRARFYELTQIDTDVDGARPGEPAKRVVEGPGLEPAEALELAKILAPIYRGPDDELGEADITPAAAELVEAWQGVGNQPDLGEFRSDLSRLDPRWIVRVATVWRMKNRAGTVGRQGVGPMLDSILSSPPPDGQAASRVHLIGHSYGAKVVLSALCTGPSKPRKVNSVLLLQPAISYLCFDPNAAGPSRPGGYVSAPDRCEQPIMTTFSACDQPLTKFYHLALRRAGDLGERSDDAPSIYAALGGFGPALPNNSVQLVNYQTVPHRYELTGNNLKIIAVNGSPNGERCDDSRGIDGHGDVSNPFTYWMLFNQVTTP